MGWKHKSNINNTKHVHNNIVDALGSFAGLSTSLNA